MTQTNKIFPFHRCFSAFALAFLALCMCGCSTRTSDKRKVLTVSIEPLRYVAEAVVGDAYRVAVLMPRGASPETYEPTPRQMMELNGSFAVFRCGTLGFEQTRLPRMAESANGIPLYDLCETIEPLVTPGHSHGKGNLHESVDPHVWMSPQNLAAMARNMCYVLCRKDSVNARIFEKNLQQFEKRMQQLDAELSKTLTPVRHRSFLIYHPALGYMARQYGLRQFAIEQDGKEPSPRAMQELIRNCRTEEVKTVFVSEEHNGRSARVAADELNANLVKINPLDYDVPAQLRSIAQQLAHE